MLIQGDNLTPAEFVWQILERDVRNIYHAQHLIVSQRIYISGKDLKAKQRKKGIERRTGTLEKSLSNPDFYIKAEGENFRVAANYPLYIRFLDMKNLGNWNIYNKQVFGILGNARKDLKSRYGENVADVIGNALREAFEKYNKKQ